MFCVLFEGIKQYMSKHKLLKLVNGIFRVVDF